MTIIPTKITAVTVYADRARVTRLGSITPDAGPSTLTIAPLPRQLDESSVRVTARGSGKITGVEVSQQRDPTAPPGAALDAQNKLQDLLDQDRILADEAEAWQARSAVIKNIGAEGGENFSRSLARGKLSVDELTATLDYLSQSQEAAAATLRDLAIRRRNLAQEIQAARDAADKLKNAAAPETVQVQIHLELPAAAPLEIELSYTIYGASWRALHDVRLDDSIATNPLEWNYLAQVQQQTGEDWDASAALTLSTASLAAGLDKPELPPWQVDVYRPPEPRMYKTRAAGAAAPAPMMAMSENAMPVMAQESAELITAGPNITYKIPSPRAIPSDGEPHQVLITTLSFPAALDFFTAPKVDPHAFIRAQFTNSSDYLLLAGDLSLYHGADFVGTRALEAIVPAQEVALFLGSDERVQVERKEVKRSVDKNLLGNTARTQLAYRIRITNPAQPTLHITVLDQIPVSQHPDIKVKLLETNPKPAAQSEQGELSWELDVPKGTTAEINFAVSVESPKELRMVGL